MSQPSPRTRPATAPRAAAPLDATARIQRALAGQLAQRICDEALPDHPRVLELDCGTGPLTAALLPRLRPALWRATDPTPAHLEACAGRLGDTAGLETRLMDSEAPDAAAESMDLVCASLAGPVFADLPTALRRLQAVLAPGGLMALTILGAETFEEWQDACEAEDIHDVRPVYPTAEMARAWLGPDAWVMEEWKSVPHGDARAFLAALEAVGARTRREDRPPAMVGALRRALRRMEEDGFDATYHVLTLRWRKPAGS